MQIIANLSMLYCDVPLIERMQAAADAGFGGVEIQFPYEVPLAELVAAKERARVAMALINIPLGNLDAGDVGLACLGARRREFHAAVETSLSYADGLGVKRINVLAGRPAQGEEAGATATLVDNLRHAADRFGSIGATVLLEPINPHDVPGFLISSLGQAISVVRAVQRDNVAVLFDIYHLTQTEASVVEAVAQAGDLIGHVQFADAPGRHQPGTGEIDFEPILRALKRSGYDGYVSAEYWPQGATADSLDWRQEFEEWI